MSTLPPNFCFLRGWQRSLATLPEGTPVYVVFCCGDSPNEPEAVFLDHAAATLWITSRAHPFNFRVEGFTVVRQNGSGLNILQFGAPPISEIDKLIRKGHRLALAPLPPDKQFKESV